MVVNDGGSLATRARQKTATVDDKPSVVNYSLSSQALQSDCRAMTPTTRNGFEIRWTIGTATGLRSTVFQRLGAVGPPNGWLGGLETSDLACRSVPAGAGVLGMGRSDRAGHQDRTA